VSAYGAIRRPSRSVKQPNTKRSERSNPGRSMRGRPRGAKRNERSNPNEAGRTSIESGAIRKRCKALSVEQGAIRCTTRTHVAGSRAICRREQVSSVERRVKSAGSIRADEAERGAICGKSRKPSVERGVIHGRREPQSAWAEQLGTGKKEKLLCGEGNEKIGRRLGEGEWTGV